MLVDVDEVEEGETDHVTDCFFLLVDVTENEHCGTDRCRDFFVS